MKPYQLLPIAECGEPLVPIPLDRFAVESPHPYEKLGAPYGGRSPFYLRQGVVEKLLAAQNAVQANHPGWRIQIFDAYRPIAVQQFMVNYAFDSEVRSRGLTLAELTEAQRQDIFQSVYQFWAVPSADVATPPPHATGAAVDVTLIAATGDAVNMGSPIDEISPRSHPDYFANSSDDADRVYDMHRQILADAMRSVGFARHPNEWWHFCYGDQMWAWLTGQDTARYGRVD